MKEKRMPWPGMILFQENDIGCILGIVQKEGLWSKLCPIAWDETFNGFWTEESGWFNDSTLGEQHLLRRVTLWGKRTYVDRRDLILYTYLPYKSDKYWDMVQGEEENKYDKK